MKILDWLKEQFAKEDRTIYEWQYLKDDEVPNWVKKAYIKKDVHHDGLVYRFNGKTFQYKVVESGHGGTTSIFYRRMKWKGASQPAKRQEGKDNVVDK
jgi:hypothetical protein